MFGNFIRIMFRSVLRNKTLTFINISGLTLGIAAFLLLLLYSKYELGYDRQYPESNKIYRIIQRVQRIDKLDEYAISPATYAPAMKDMFPEVKDYTRFTYYETGVANLNENKIFNEKKFGFVDSNFLKIFNFPLKYGDAQTVLSEPYSIVLTERIANKYFGNQYPVGKVLRVGNLFNYKVTGVLRDNISQSHLSFDMLASFSTLYSISASDANAANLPFALKVENKGFSAYSTYLILKDGVNYKALESKFAQFIEIHRGEGKSKIFKPKLQPITEIHLNSHYTFDSSSNSSYATVYSFLTIAIFILLIACVNYMNLSTAQYSKRAKEVGIRKVLGSNKSQLIYQFILESFLITLVSIVLAIVIVISILPEFNNLFERDIKFSLTDDGQLFIYLLVIWFVTGSVSGIYPAFFLSNFQPVKVLKGKFSSGKSSAFFRKSLVIFQFSISMTLVIVTLIVNKQLSYIRDKDLGYNKSQVIVIPFGSDWLRNNISNVKNQLFSEGGITNVSAGSGKLGLIETFLDSGIRQEGSDENDYVNSILNAGVDYNFMKLMDIKILEGRDFNEAITTDISEAFLINQSAAKMLGGDPLGKTFIVRSALGAPRNGKIIGIFEDIIFSSLHQNTQPLLFHADTRSFGYLYIKLNQKNITGTLNFIKNKWNEWLPSDPFEYQFLDENFGLIYKEEQKLAGILNSFAFFAIFIACLGLWGLASFSVEIKRKEVSIRKVLGASPFSIIYNLLQDYFNFILFAFVISVPVAWYIINSWLSDFAYRIKIQPLYFITGGFIVLIISVGTVLYHVLNSIRINPSTILRAE